MSETPSKRRRKGREAYYRGGNPDELNPYEWGGGRGDWRDGWNAESAIDEVRRAEEIEREAMNSMPISYAIGECDASESVKEILRRIADHVEMFQ